MDKINVKIIHPTNNSNMDIGLPENLLLKDLFNQLIDANFLTGEQSYTSVLKPGRERTENKPLDNDKTVGENCIENNDVILILPRFSWHECGVCFLFSYLNKISELYSEMKADTLETLEANGGKHSIIDWNRFLQAASLCKDFLNIMDDCQYLCGSIGCSVNDIEITLQKRWWKTHELALKLDKSNETAVNLLHILGYQFHDKIGIFSRTEETDRIAAKMQNS